MEKRVVLVAACILVFVSISLAQQDTAWSAWRWLIGEWVGEGSGAPGHGTGWFSFTQELGGKVIVRKGRSDYPGTKERPGLVHEDLMIVYLDETHRPDRAIYFDNEGHTINYSIAYSDSTIVFTSAKISGTPVFRLSYRPIDLKTVEVRFEMSQDGEKFVTYVEGKSVKK